MNENMKAFLKKVMEDKSLAAKLEACKSPDEAYAVASGEMDGFTKEEFFATMEQFKAAIDNSGDLTDEDLAKMSGGVGATHSTTDLVTFSVVVSVTAAGAAAI